MGFEDVFGSGSRRSLPAGSLRLTRQGESVPFHLGSAGQAPHFGPGVTLYFLSEGAEANPYGNEAVYELETGVSGDVMPVGNASPSGEPTSFYWETVEKEENRIYQAALVDAPDRWLWSVLFAPATKNFSFQVSAPAATPSPALLEIWLQGGSDFDVNPDHHVRLFVNAVLVGEASWNGKKPVTMRADLLPGLLHEGENRLEIENVRDTGARYSMVFLNRYRVSYPRLPVAAEGRLEGGWSESGTTEVVGLSPQASLVELTENAPVWLDGAEPTLSGIRFRAESGRSYLVVSPEAVRHVSAIRKPLRSRPRGRQSRLGG